MQGKVGQWFWALSLTILQINCSLPSPLQWNKARQWDFHIILDEPAIYLLRDHVTLLTDLGKDWSAGPPVDIMHFIPMKYVVTIVLKNYSLSFNVNDQNIVDSPNDPDVNSMRYFKPTSCP
jgi:hypothetical protein